MQSVLLICTRNRVDSLRRTLGFVMAAASPPTLIVVVDSSSKGKLEDVQELVSSVGGRYIHTTPSLPRQRNIALAEVPRGSKFVHFLDDDADVHPNYFVHTEKLLKATGVVGVGHRTLDNPDFPLTSSFDGKIKKPGIVTRWGENMPFSARGTYEVEWLPGCAMSYKYEEVESISFDERRKKYALGEDVDYSLKAGRRGTLLITDTVPVLHRKEASGRPSRSQYASHFLRNLLLLSIEHAEKVSAKDAFNYAFFRLVNASLGELRGLIRAAVPISVRSRARAVIAFLGKVRRNLNVRGIRKFFGLTHRDNAHEFGPNPGSSSSLTFRLQGGLGNQLFQLAAGLEATARLGVDLELSVNSFTELNPRTYSLSPLESLGFTVVDNPEPANFREEHFYFSPSIWSVKPGSIVEGFFQSWKYFGPQKENLVGLIREHFSPGEVLWSPSGWTSVGELSGGYIGLQVRRGDYLFAATREFHGLVSFEYFISAASELRSKLGGLPVVIFSDSVEAGVELTKLIECSYVHIPGNSENSDLISMATIANAAGLAISNSSFGWWSAYSSRAVPVIVPTPWILGTEYRASDLFLPEWRVASASDGVKPAGHESEVDIV